MQSFQVEYLWKPSDPFVVRVLEIDKEIDSSEKHKNGKDDGGDDKPYVDHTVGMLFSRKRCKVEQEKRRSDKQTLRSRETITKSATKSGDLLVKSFSSNGLFNVFTKEFDNFVKVVNFGPVNLHLIHDHIRFGSHILAL